MSRARDTAGIIQYNKISIDSNNAVGIGSSIPDCKLDIDGGLRVVGVSTFEGKTEFTTDNVVLTSTNQLRLGSGENSFFYVGSDNNTYLQTNNNDLLIGGPTVKLQSYGTVSSAGENYLIATQNGAVELYYDNVRKFETTAQGIEVTGHSELDNVNIAGVVTATTFSGSGASLNTLNASELDSGTIPDARFPATLPAVSGANLTNLNIPASFNDLDAALFS